MTSFWSLVKISAQFVGLASGCGAGTSGYVSLHNISSGFQIYLAFGSEDIVQTGKAFS